MAVAGHGSGLESIQSTQYAKSLARLCTVASDADKSLPSTGSSTGAYALSPGHPSEQTRTLHKRRWLPGARKHACGMTEGEEEQGLTSSTDTGRMTRLQDREKNVSTGLSDLPTAAPGVSSLIFCHSSACATPLTGKIQTDSGGLDVRQTQGFLKSQCHSVPWSVPSQAQDSYQVLSFAPLLLPYPVSSTETPASVSARTTMNYSQGHQVPANHISATQLPHFQDEGLGPGWVPWKVSHPDSRCLTGEGRGADHDSIHGYCEATMDDQKLAQSTQHKLTFFTSPPQRPSAV